MNTNQAMQATQYRSICICWLLCQEATYINVFTKFYLPNMLLKSFSNYFSWPSKRTPFIWRSPYCFALVCCKQHVTTSSNFKSKQRESQVWKQCSTHWFKRQEKEKAAWADSMSLVSSYSQIRINYRKLYTWWLTSNQGSNTILGN